SAATTSNITKKNAGFGRPDIGAGEVMGGKERGSSAFVDYCFSVTGPRFFVELATGDVSGDLRPNCCSNFVRMSSAMTLSAAFSALISATPFDDMSTATRALPRLLSIC